MTKPRFALPNIGRWLEEMLPPEFRDMARQGVTHREVHHVRKTTNGRATNESYRYRDDTGFDVTIEVEPLRAGPGESEK